MLREYVGSHMTNSSRTSNRKGPRSLGEVASQAQTDDVVEGVGAMELLHTIVFDRGEEMGELRDAS